MTGDPRRWGSEPGTPGMVKFWGPYTYRSAFHAADDAEECARALAHLADVIMVEGAQHVAAIVLETVVGTNGILVPPDGYLQGVRDLCDQHGIVMIADEVMAGFGRCGEWFAVDHWDVTPDLICFAKGVNSGLRPARRRRHQPAHRRLVRRPAVPRRPDLLRPPAGLRLGRGQHQHLQGGGHHRARPPPGHRHRRAGAGRDGRASPVGRRGARPRRVLGHRAGRATARPASRWCRTTPPAPATAPMVDLAAACKQRGLWPFTHFNRLHVVPPLTTSDDDMRDRAWRSSTRPSTVADEHATA